MNQSKEEEYCGNASSILDGKWPEFEETEQDDSVRNQIDNAECSAQYDQYEQTVRADYSRKVGVNNNHQIMQNIRELVAKKHALGANSNFGRMNSTSKFPSNLDQRASNDENVNDDEENGNEDGKLRQSSMSKRLVRSVKRDAAGGDLSEQRRFRVVDDGREGKHDKRLLLQMEDKSPTRSALGTVNFDRSSVAKSVEKHADAGDLSARLIQKFRDHTKELKSRKSNVSDVSGASKRSRSLSSKQINRIKGIAMVQKAKNNISGIINRAVSKESGDRSPIGRERFNPKQSIDGGLPQLMNLAQHEPSPQKSESETAQNQVRESQNALQNLKAQQNLFEFDKSGNEHTFFFKEFLDGRELEENMNQLKQKQEEFDRGLERFRKATAEAQEVEAHHKDAFPLLQQPPSKGLGLTALDLSHDIVPPQGKISYDSPQFKLQDSEKRNGHPATTSKFEQASNPFELCKSLDQSVLTTHSQQPPMQNQLPLPVPKKDLNEKLKLKVKKATIKQKKIVQMEGGFCKTPKPSQSFKQAFNSYVQGSPLNTMQSQNVIVLERSGYNGIGGLGLGVNATAQANIRQLSSRSKNNTVNEETVNVEKLNKRFDEQVAKSVQFASVNQPIRFYNRNGSACAFSRNDSIGSNQSRSKFKLNLTHLSQKNKKIQEINSNLLKSSKSHNNLLGNGTQAQSKPQSNAIQINKSIDLSNMQETKTDQPTLKPVSDENYNTQPRSERKVPKSFEQSGAMSAIERDKDAAVEQLAPNTAIIAAKYDAMKLKETEEELGRVRQNNKTMKQQQRQLLQLLQDKDQQLDDIINDQGKKTAQIRRAQARLVAQIVKRQNRKPFLKWKNLAFGQRRQHNEQETVRQRVEQFARMFQTLRLRQLKESFDQIQRKGTQVEKANYSRIFAVMTIMKVVGAKVGEDKMAEAAREEYSKASLLSAFRVISEYANCQGQVMVRKRSSTMKFGRLLCNRNLKQAFQTWKDRISQDQQGTKRAIILAKLLKNCSKQANQVAYYQAILAFQQNMYVQKLKKMKDTSHLLVNELKSALKTMQQQLQESIHQNQLLQDQNRALKEKQDNEDVALSSDMQMIKAEKEAADIKIGMLEQEVEKLRSEKARAQELSVMQTRQHQEDRESISELQGQVEQLNQEITELIKGKEEQFRLQQEVKSLEIKAVTAESMLREKEEEIERILGEKRQMAEELTIANEQQFQEQIKALESTIEELRQREQLNLEQINELQSQQDAQQLLQKQQQSQLEAETESKIEKFRDQIEELNFTIEQKQQALMLKDKQVEMQQHQFQQEKSVVEARLEKEITAQLEALETVQMQETQLKEKDEEIQSQVKMKSELESRIETLSAQLDELTQLNTVSRESEQGKLDELQQLLSKKSQESIALQSMLDNMKMTMEQQAQYTQQIQQQMAHLQSMNSQMQFQLQEQQQKESQHSEQMKLQEKNLEEARAQLAECQQQKGSQDAFFKGKIQQMEEQVKVFVEGEQRQYMQKLQEQEQKYIDKIDEKDRQCKQQVDELNQKLSQKEQLLQMHKSHSEDIMKEVMQITQKEKQVESEMRELRTQLNQADQQNKELTEQNRSAESQIEELKKVIFEQERQMSQKQQLLVSYQQETSVAQDKVVQENQSIKGQIQQLSQHYQASQDALNDARAEKDRLFRDLEQMKKKYNDAKGEAQTAYKGLENYQVILTKFEENLKTQIKAKEAAELERDKALNEMRIVRQRYVKIVGVDQFTKDFGDL